MGLFCQRGCGGADCIIALQKPAVSPPPGGWHPGDSGGKDMTRAGRRRAGAVVLLLLLAGFSRAEDADAQAMKAVERLGGKAIRDNDLEGKPVIAVFFDGAKV